VAVSTGRSVFYASGEESAGQIKNRLTRLKCDLRGIRFTSETNAERIAASIRELKPELAIVDSIQTMYSGGVSSEPGSVTQVRAATMSLLETAKQENVPVVLVGHITKEGQAAGPKTLEHIVDAVLYLEAEKSRDFRILRSPKNRFGSASEVGIFEMTGAGFQEVKNPTAVFLDEESPRAAGSVISCVMEGTRPFLVEVQALVSKTVFGYPQRRSSGFDLNRLQVLAAVLAKRAALSLLNQDIVLNVAGGLKVSEPSLDLAVCLAVASSLFDRELGRDTIVMGEVGLGGEVRNVGKLKERIREAKNLGFKRAVVPVSSLRESGMELVRVKHIHEAVAKSGLASKAS
jgi:DNA repair protein RadA/Sms